MLLDTVFVEALIVDHGYLQVETVTLTRIRKLPQAMYLHPVTSIRRSRLPVLLISRLFRYDRHGVILRSLFNTALI